MKKVNYFYLIYNLFILVLCCPICYYLNLHSGHKVILINDEESLKKENIKIEVLVLDKTSQKVVKLKKTIENEINKINIIYDKVNNELSQFFLKDHERLIKEEAELRENLQNKVTKIKEILESFLTECNFSIKSCEKITKEIKIFENNKDKDIIKKLAYISQISILEKNMTKLLSEFISNFNISFNAKEKNFRYEEYYFNGIQIPKNIEFKDVKSDGFKIVWKIDNINVINVDKKKIKFITELRKDMNEKFEKVYEGYESNCLVKNLKKSTNYEIKICCVYDDILGPWTPIQKIKTNNIVFQLPVNPKYITMNFKNVEYGLISHRYYENEFTNDSTKLSIHNQYLDKEMAKWLFIPDENNLVTIIFDIDSFGMKDWKLYSDGQKVFLSKNLSSKFELILINQNKFYIRDIKSGKYLSNSKNTRDIASYYIGLENLDNRDNERFTFYFKN